MLLDRTMLHTPQLRRLTLIRHAKAMPDAGDDHARILAPLGREAATELGVWLRESHTLPDLVLCSTAQRTRETLAAMQLNTTPVILSEPAYLASVGELLTLLQGMDDRDMHIALIGHNPGVHGLVALLARDFVREADSDQVAARFPTAGLVSMTVPIAHWHQLAPQSATVDALRFQGGE